MTPEALQTILARSGLPEGLCWAASAPVPGMHGLFPEERAAMSRAVRSRREEFAGGRAAARMAMTQLDLPPLPVPPGPDRAPRWPEGVTGSISHAGGLCLAVAGRSETWRGIGIDIEPDTPLDPELISEVATPEELARTGLPEGLGAKRIFSAKEAAYKAQYTLTRTLFGFGAMAADLRGGRLEMVQETGLGRGAVLPVLQVAEGGVIVSLTALRACPENELTTHK